MTDHAMQQVRNLKLQMKRVRGGEHKVDFWLDNQSHHQESSRLHCARNLVASSKPYYPKDAFSINSAATYHLTGNKQLFDEGSLVDVSDTLMVGNDYPMYIEGRGSISRRNVTLPDVRYVPGLKVNVVSLALLIAMDYDVQFTKHGCKVKEKLGSELVGEATLVDGLYMVDYLRVPLDRSCLPDYETVEAALSFRVEGLHSCCSGRVGPATLSS